MVEVIRWTHFIMVIGLAVVIGSIMVTSAEDLVIISIDSPSDGETVYSKMITVSGIAAAMGEQYIDSVTVNGVLSGTTLWRAEISLQAGLNTITVVATTDTGNRAIKTITVFYNAPTTFLPPTTTPPSQPPGDHGVPSAIPTPIPMPTGSISITTIPSGAEVYWDGSFAGNTPITREDVVGQHKIRISKEGYRSEIMNIDLYKGITKKQNIELEPITGSIVVYSTPSGASVYLDDEDMNKITPCMLSEVVVGQHTIKLTKSGYDDVITNVSVSVGRTFHLHENLTESTRYGSINISSDPSGAKVYLDGNYTGETTPKNISKVVVGDHTIKLTKFGYDDVIRNVSVSVGETLHLHENLAGYGSLRISSYPSGAKVYLDGDYKGITPLDISKVVVGSYSIKLTKFGYASVEKKIDVSAGKSTLVDETLSVAAFIFSSTIAILMGIISITITSLFFLIKVIAPRRKKDALSKSNMKDKQKIDFAKRKEIIELNSQDGIKHKDYPKINLLYEKARELEKREENKESIETYEKIIDINEYYIKAWEGLERNYNALGESGKKYSALKKIRSITEFIDFATNAAQKINLQQFELQNLDFFDNLFWSFQPQINILLGKNGYGKTYLLRLLISLLQKDDDISSEFFKGKKSKYLFSWENVPRGDINRLLRFLVDDLDIDWAENVKIHKSDDGKIIRIFKDENSAEIKIDEEKEKATLKISDGRSHGLKVKKENGKLNIYTTNSFVSCDLERNNVEKVIYRTKTVFKESIGKVPVLAIPDMRLVDKSKTTIEPIILDTDIRESGAYHFLYEKPYEEVIQNFLYELCIRYMDKGKSFEQPLFQLLHKIVRKLTDKEFRFDEIVAIGSAKFEIKVITEGNPKKQLLLQKASQGTLSILSIFGLIYYYLTSVFPDTPEEELLKKPAIVFIDEIDAHLHPSWQQKIIGLLRENFPNVQFIVTAQSPLVVAGCYENEVAVLRKGKGGFTIEQFERDFIGYEAKDLYQIIFEIEEKDEPYLQYTALQPFKEEIVSDISLLERKKKVEKLSDEGKRKLHKLYAELHYIEQTRKKYDERTQPSNLLVHNRRLKAEIEKLKKRINKK